MGLTRCFLMILRILPSDENYEEINILAQMIAELKNPQLFFNLQDITLEERLRWLEEAEALFEELMH